ncbi:hypothetical protein JK361_38295 [Streptomyces sp. 5-8]|uniref:DUF6434 domain-containing protein n=1 Tax=Streptomyces musisoli TaxID=2802280 RepID=A0ABS1PDJ8_9ACTN|nr:MULTISPECIES: DUF6434 domain-containing protein [Streptomyces]MBL1110339.1 hypothetical protein [Streptomyces musisoli]MBY8845942.1 SAP domain-containing protein [Streptomyces sp. SP2-10]
MNENQNTSTTAAGSRPPLTAALTGAELLRWYWTLDELTGLARTMGVARHGGKAALTARLAAALDGLPLPPAPARRRATAQLAEPVDHDTVIPPGQRCSQVLRRYFVEAIGPGFHFDSFMRAFIAGHPGRTLADAVAHWHATRPDAARPREIAEQFEFNRFTSAWHRQNPGGTRAGAREAWYAHRALPKPTGEA